MPLPWSLSTPLSKPPLARQPCLLPRGASLCNTDLPYLECTFRKLTQAQHCYPWVTVNCRHPLLSSSTPTQRLCLAPTTWRPILKLSLHPASPPFQGTCSPPPKCSSWPPKAPRSPPSSPPLWRLLIQLFSSDSPTVKMHPGARGGCILQLINCLTLTD